MEAICTNLMKYVKYLCIENLENFRKIKDLSKEKYITSMN